MDGLAASGNADLRRVIFQESAARREIPRTEIIEKDFWVCWTLRRLFELSDQGSVPMLSFKGGTSLSKVYRLIDRFSEDIDISLDRSRLLRDGELDPLKAKTTTQQKKMGDLLRERGRVLVADETKPLLQSAFAEHLGSQAWTLEIDSKDRFTLLFRYPASFPPSPKSPIGRQIKIDFGIGDQNPSCRTTIKPYSAELFPEHFSNPEVQVNALGVERTFWEKVLIPHQYYHLSLARPDEDPRSISRHYYDVARMTESTDLETWLLDPHGIRQEVIEFKKVLFRSPKAKYDDARLGQRSLRLVPHSAWEAKLRRDYASMQEMFFGEDPPRFDDLLVTLGTLESRLNR